MKAPKKRIKWGHSYPQSLEDKKLMKTWEKGLCSEEVLCGILRNQNSLEDFTDDEIMENVAWLGYDRRNADEDWADWRGYE